MLKLLSAPAKIMLTLCSTKFGIGFWGLLIALFFLMFSIFSYLRSRFDDPPPRYMFYIKLQIYLPIMTEVLIIASYFCLCITEPQTIRHIFAGLGIVFLVGLSIFLGCELGSLYGLWFYYKDKPPLDLEEDDENNKDNNRKD